MIADALTIEVGRRDASGRHHIVARNGIGVYQFRCNIDSAAERRGVRQSIITRFGLSDEAHEWLEERFATGAESAEADSEVITCSTVRLSDVVPERVEWEWANRFAIGKLGIIAGDPGVGKSFLTIDIAARITTGEGYPDAPAIRRDPGDVVILSAEDDLGDTIRPRFDAHGGDAKRVLAITGAKFVDDDCDRLLNLETDLEAVRNVVRKANRPRALIIDPVSAYLGKTDSHKNAEVRAVLAPLSDLAAEFRIAVICVSHLRKGEGAALYRVMGSLAFCAAARTGWVVVADELNPRRRLMLPLKNNIAPDVGGLAFAIVENERGEAVVGWEHETVRISADDAIGSGRRSGRVTQVNRAVEWLSEALGSGPRPRQELLAEGRDRGFSESSLKRAFAVIGGVATTRGFPARAMWSCSRSTLNQPLFTAPTDPTEPTEKTT